jgi:enamine deaminase RidA (YjgF/YER057c/UK114 family)
MNFLQNIRAEILDSSNIQSCLVYPNARGEVVAPAVFLEIASYNVGNDPATGELALTANVEARVVVDSTIEDAEIVCQLLGCEIANIAHLNSFGCNISPAKVSGITRDFFKPEFDMYVCWLVEWTHEFHAGSSVFTESGVPPHVLHVGGDVIE